MVMSAFWEGAGQQLKAPRGRLGRWMGHAMQLANARVNALAVAALAPEVGERIAELGCGPGAALRRILSFPGVAHVTGIDHSEVMIAQARGANRAALAQGRLSLHCADFSALPLRDGSLDAVLAVNVAYFMQDGAAIREAHRVLKPGGRLVIYATSRASMQGWPFAGAHSHRLFDQFELLDLLRSGGFLACDVMTETVAAGFGVRGFLTAAYKSR